MSQSSSGQSNQPRANTARSRVPQRPYKRLILCEDGSWLNADRHGMHDGLAIPSNVVRLSRAIKATSSDGIQQVAYYHWGVGAGGGALERLNAINGGGLSEIVREGYQFICTNWLRGDEIFLFGFSRGSYTARAIAGFIGEVGVLTNEGLDYLPEIYRDVKHKHDRDYVPKHTDIPFPDKPSALDPSYRKELQRRGLTTLNVPIKLIGVFDTVGALGVPKVGWLTRMGLQSSTMREMAFYDTSLSNCIENAFQALALDERRFAFQPTLWEKLDDNETELRQVWFPGAHSNIGGGLPDRQIETISFTWMVAQCQPFLDFDLDYIYGQWDAIDEYYEEESMKIRPWSFGRISNGVRGAYALGGTITRRPGTYTVTDPTSGKVTHEPLLDTNEAIHACVRARIKLRGPAVNDDGEYEPKSLRDWKLVIEEGDRGGKGPNIYWRSRLQVEDGFPKYLPEARLKPLEIELLQYDKETRDYVLRPAGVRQRKSVRDRSNRDRSRHPVSR